MKVLTIDGGGIRGLIAALVLAEIERRCDRPAGRAVRPRGRDVDRRDHRLRADAARAAGRRADRRIYVEEGPDIFDRSLLKRITSAEGYLDERYDSDGLVTALRRHLATTRLAEARPAILLTAYDIELRNARFLRRDRRPLDGRRRPRELGGAELLRAGAGGPGDADRRRRVRHQPGDVRVRRGRRRPRAARLARLRRAHAAAAVRGGARLGPARVGAAGARRGVRRHGRRGRPPAPRPDRRRLRAAARRRSTRRATTSTTPARRTSPRSRARPSA